LDTQSNILNGCRIGDRISQEQLYKQFYPALFALCKLFFDDDHEAQSALNNGMLLVFTKINQYDEGKGRLFNWVYTLVRNACLTQLRNKKNLFVTETIPDDFQFVAQAEDVVFKWIEERDIRIRFALLPANTRAVCKLYYLDGLPIKEIAFELQINEGTIKWLLSEGRKQLKVILQKVVQ
jgi:RNA polymerase sigma factor (sigma-70 family)